jgi:chemotaxis protein CheC
MYAFASEEHRDALTELVNIGMGQAGDRLARLFGRFIELSIPRLRLVRREEALEVAHELIGPGPIVATRQAFASQMRGEAIAVFDAASCASLCELMNYPSECADEAILEVSNLLVGACLTGVAAQISRELTFSPPSILGSGQRVGDALALDDARWSCALIANVNFTMEGQHFRASLLVFWPDDAIATLDEAVGELLAELSS